MQKKILISIKKRFHISKDHRYADLSFSLANKLINDLLMASILSIGSCVCWIAEIVLWLYNSIVLIFHLTGLYSHIEWSVVLQWILVATWTCHVFLFFLARYIFNFSVCITSGGKYWEVIKIFLLETFSIKILEREIGEYAKKNSQTTH